MKTPQQIVIELLRAGWNQSAIAREAGVAQPVVNRIYKGKTLKARFETYERLAKLDVTKPPPGQRRRMAPDAKTQAWRKWVMDQQMYESQMMGDLWYVFSDAWDMAWNKYKFTKTVAERLAEEVVNE
jgi:transcriptional regulator with XRE-family HTH domain